MTQRQVDHDTPLPACRNGHKARHMLDGRRPEAGGGHFVECACGRTQKHATFADAMIEWRRGNGIRAARQPRPSATNVVQMGLTLRQRGAR
ncbi:MAG TPA: hypothetical protein VM687_04410 [Stenotrophomonas sp.]|nr:hypothetical protein [Stenotrophomonas sp.]